MTSKTILEGGRETPVFFPAGREMLFGMFAPAAHPSATGVIALPDAGGPASLNRNRWWVRLSRSLALHGCHVLRFDYHGMGESTGVVERFRLDDPFVDDLMGAIDWSGKHDVERFILVGSCFGARTALAAAEEIRRLDGVVLISVGLRDLEKGEAAATRRVHDWRVWNYVVRGLHPRVLRGLLSPRHRRGYVVLLRMKWQAARAALRGRLGRTGEAGPAWLTPVSGQFIRALESLVRRGVPILFLFGTEDEFYAEFSRATTGELSRILSLGGDRVQVITVPGRLHNFVSVEGQAAALDIVTDWVGRHQGDSAGRREGSQVTSDP